MAAAALLALAAAAPAARAEEDAAATIKAEPIVDAAALRPFFRALDALDRPRARQPVRIMQIGDSHTANDALSGRLREALQTRFGAAGRGWLPAGIPFKYYRPALVSVSETGWRHIKPGDADAAGRLFGLDASVVEPEAAGAAMTLTSTEADGFDRISIEYVARPHSPPLSLRLDNDAEQTITTAAMRPAPRLFTKVLLHPAHQAKLVAAAGEGGAELLGWAVERRGPGIVYENHGTIGATVALLAKLSPATVSFELAQRRPALLVVAFGTNEGFEDSLDLDAYARAFRDAVANLVRHAPGAAVLILGSPDGNRRSADCTAEAAAAPPADCGEYSGCAWTEPRNLAAVRDIQRRIARQRGWAFWDWSAAMGGSCSIGRWLAHEPPWAAADHVHLNKAGYAAVADGLFAELMKQYDAWKSGRPPPRHR